MSYKIKMNGVEVECDTPKEIRALLQVETKEDEPVREKRKYRKKRRTGYRAKRWTEEEDQYIEKTLHRPQTEVARAIGTRTMHAIGIRRSRIAKKLAKLEEETRPEEKKHFWNPVKNETTDHKTI